MTETKKTTTPNASVGADAVQPLLKNSTNSITDSSNNCNLKTISMTELKNSIVKCNNFLPIFLYILSHHNKAVNIHSFVGSLL